MDSSDIEGVQQLHKVINVHGTCTHLVGIALDQDLLNHLLHVQLHGHVNILQRALQFEVFLEHLQDRGGLEGCAQCLVLTQESDSRETIPFAEVDRWRRIPRLNAHHTGLDLWWGSEVVLAHLHDHVDTGQELCVYTQPAVEFVTRLGYQTLCKLPLEHENCTAEVRTMEEQFEDQWGTDLVRDVGDAQVEERQFRLQHITDKDLQFGLHGRAKDTLLQLSHETGIDFTGDHLLGLFQDLHRHVTSTGTDFQDDICGSQGSFVQHACDDQGIFQNMLAKVLVEDDS